MDAGNWIALGALLFTIIVSLFSGFRYIASQRREIDTEARALEKTMRAELDGAERSLSSKMDALKEGEAKARHDLGGQMQRIVAEMKQEHRDANNALLARMHQLEREYVSKADMSAMETRLIGQFDKLERRLEQIVAGRGPVKTADA